MSDVEIEEEGLCERDAEREAILVGDSVVVVETDDVSMPDELLVTENSFVSDTVMVAARDSEVLAEISSVGLSVAESTREKDMVLLGEFFSENEALTDVEAVVDALGASVIEVVAVELIDNECELDPIAVSEWVAVNDEDVEVDLETLCDIDSSSVGLSVQDPETEAVVEALAQFVSENDIDVEVLPLFVVEFDAVIEAVGRVSLSDHE